MSLHTGWLLLLKNFFTGYEHRKALNDEPGVLLLLLTMVIPSAVLFSAINAVYEQWLLSCLLALVAMALSPFLYFGRQGIWFSGFQYVIMLVAVVVFIALFVLGGIADLGVYWTLIFPFFAFLLTGVWQGWRWIALFLSLQAVVFILHVYGWIMLPYTAETMVLAPLMFIFFTLVACVFELQNEKHRLALTQANTELSLKEDALTESASHLEQQVFQRTRELQETNTRLVEEVKRKELAIASMKQSEMKFQHAQRMESVGTLVGGIAHDFNNT